MNSKILLYSLVAILAFTVAVSLSGCGKKSQQQAQNQPPGQTQTQPGQPMDHGTDTTGMQPHDHGMADTTGRTPATTPPATTTPGTHTAAADSLMTKAGCPTCHKQGITTTKPADSLRVFLTSAKHPGHNAAKKLTKKELNTVIESLTGTPSTSTQGTKGTRSRTGGTSGGGTQGQ